MSDREDRLVDARDWAREILYGDGFDANGQPVEDDELEVLEPPC